MTIGGLNLILFTLTLIIPTGSIKSQLFHSVKIAFVVVVVVFLMKHLKKYV